MDTSKLVTLYNHRATAKALNGAQILKKLHLQPSIKDTTIAITVARALMRTDTRGISAE